MEASHNGSDDAARKGLLKDGLEPFKQFNDLLMTADPLVESIAQVTQQYISKREEHYEIARLWTKRYAT